MGKAFRLKMFILLGMITGTFVCGAILQMGGWILRNSWRIKPDSMVSNVLTADPQENELIVEQEISNIMRYN